MMTSSTIPVMILTVGGVAATVGWVFDLPTVATVGVSLGVLALTICVVRRQA